MSGPGTIDGTMPCLLHADWPAPRGVHALTTLRFGAGSSSSPFDTFNLGNFAVADGDAPNVVARNRAELVEHAGLPSTPHWLRQVHGIDVVRFGAGPLRHNCQSDPPLTEDHEVPTADASVTSSPGNVLAILTADCLPVVFAAADGSEVGAAHAGWRGLVSGVLEATVAAMRTAPSQLLAWLGPAAGPRAYEVGAEVFDAFVARDARARQAFVATRPGHWRVDLYALARQRLADAGVHHVHGGDACTISEPERLFSHRRDRRSGRMATLVWMEPLEG